MRARVYDTGQVIEVEKSYITDRGGMFRTTYVDKKTGTSYYRQHLDFNVPDEPDYWEKLKHQYAGMAMQGILSNEDYCQYLVDRIQDGGLADSVARCAKDFATALVEKLKNE